MKAFASYPPPADTSTPLIDRLVAIIVLSLVLIIAVSAVAYRIYDKAREESKQPKPVDEAAERQLVKDIEQWRRER